MIISHKHRFIFIKNEKTAGSSIEIALSKICGPDDVLTKLTEEDDQVRQSLGYRTLQNTKIPFSKYTKLDYFVCLFKRRLRTFHSHSSGAEIKKYIDSNQWNSYFKFCFERNPYDKFVSWYYWQNKMNQHQSMKHFIESGEASRVRGFELYTIDALPIVDKVYRFEDLQGGLDDLSKRLNLKAPLKLPLKKAKGNVRKDKSHYRDVLGDYERNWVSKTFAREIAFFNYQF